MNDVESTPPAPPKSERNPYAYWSFVLGVAAFPLTIVFLGVFAAFAGILLGHSALRLAKREPQAYGRKRLAVVGLALGYAGIVFNAYMLQSWIRPRANGHPRPRCQANLHQFRIAFNHYAIENERGYWPDISDTPGRLSPVVTQLYADYIVDPSVFVCDKDSDAERFKNERDPRILIDDHSYFYLGWTVTNEEDVEHYAAAYRASFERGIPMAQALEEMGASPKRVMRLKEDLDDELDVHVPSIYDPEMPEVIEEWRTKSSYVPVLIERIGNHEPRGGNVLYLDGHVEFVRAGNWPMTERTIKALEELDALGDKTREHSP